jgi:hypothetical protein
VAGKVIPQYFCAIWLSKCFVNWFPYISVSDFLKQKISFYYLLNQRFAHGCYPTFRVSLYNCFYFFHMNLLDFIRRFPGENECLQYFISIRENVGIKCKKCGCTKHSWVSEKDQFQCAECENHIGIKSGTIMENTKLPIKYWFITIYMLTSYDKNFSAIELQQKLGCRESEQVEEMLFNLNMVKKQSNCKYTFDSFLYKCLKQSF